MNMTSTKKQSYDLIVTGGGAAGMFAAGSAASAGLRVCLVEQNDRPGRKLRITGKGRCNVTSDSTVEEVLAQVVRNPRFLYSAMAAFPPARTMEFFESRGCPLKVERGKRVFPVSDRAADIAAVLQREMARGGVQVVQDRVTGLLQADGRAAGVQCTGGSLTGRAVLLATGGCSYPATGSDGSGYALAAAAGHTIIPPRGSLVPLVEDGSWCARLQGLSLRNAGLTLADEKGKTVYTDFGEMLFTGDGLSGPTVLSASARMQPGKHYTVRIDLKPALDAQKLDRRMLRDLGEYRNRTMEHALVDLYPRSLIPVMLERAGLDPQLRANALTRAQRQTLLELTKSFPVEIAGTRPIAEAIVTAGGVKVSEVSPKTMESKKLPGLYFAGEILDVDACTGGFNLQIAWATAHAAATAVCAL